MFSLLLSRLLYVTAHIRSPHSIVPNQRRHQGIGLPRIRR